MKKFALFVLPVLVASLIFFAACGDENKSGDVTTDSVSATQEDVTDISSQESDFPTEAATSEEAATVPVETPYGDLRFPEAMSDALDTEIEDDGEGSCRVSFFALLNERRYPLYIISIGSGEGDEVGTLTGPDGIERNVYLTVSDNDLSDVDENEKMSVYAMQETLNDVISNLGH